MSEFVESLRRLYKEDKIFLEKLNDLLLSGKIKENEYNYIISVKEV